MNLKVLKIFLPFFMVLFISCEESKVTPAPDVPDGFLVNVGEATILLQDMVLDASGNTYMVGNASLVKDTPLTVGNQNLLAKGGGDGFLAKYNSAGKPVWAKIIGAGQQEETNAVAVDNQGNVYVAGFFRTETNLEGVHLKIDELKNSSGIPNMLDMFLVKYNADGKQQWVKKVSGVGYERPTAIQIDGTGNVYITGYFNSNINFGDYSQTTDGSAFFIASYTPTGSVSWAKTYGRGQGSIYPSNMKLNSQGRIIISGSFEATKNIDGQVVSSSGDQDIFIAEFTNSGNLVWLKSFGGARGETTKGLTIDADDNIYMGGLYRSNFSIGEQMLSSNDSDAFLSKFSRAGDAKWTQQIKGFGEDNVKDLVAFDGQILMSGYFMRDVSIGDTTLHGSDYNLSSMLAQFSTDGEFKSATKLNVYDGLAFKLAYHASGNVFLAGNFSRTFTLNGSELIPKGQGNIFLAKYKFEQ